MEQAALHELLWRERLGGLQFRLMRPEKKRSIYKPRWTGLRGLVFGLVLLGAVLAVRLALDSYLEHRFPFSAFTLITAIVAWLAGWRNAAVIHLVGLVAGDWFFIPPRYEFFHLSVANTWGMGLYVSIGIVICAFAARWQASVRMAEEEIAERHRAEQELRVYADDLESRVAARTQELRDALGRLQSFTYSMVHDMRAPLRAISSFVSLLEEESASSREARDYASRVKDAAHRLDDLITDLQSYANASSGAVPIDAIDLERLVDDLIAQYPVLHNAREQIHVHRPMPRACGNAALLTQAIAHLLENAIKFVPSSRTPEVHVKTERQDRTVRLWIIDNGVGIAPQYHEKIFGLFERLEVRGTGRSTGIGLPIARRAAERMYGRIGVESVPDQGSRFWIELPAATLLSPPCQSPRDRAKADPLFEMTEPEFHPVE
jgi:signal transduction histidine kinase